LEQEYCTFICLRTADWTAAAAAAAAAQLYQEAGLEKKENIAVGAQIDSHLDGLNRVHRRTDLCQHNGMPVKSIRQRRL
jgi:hypothetical protein